MLEFQQKTGSGWPHWHILVDRSDAPGKKINLDRAWELWRDKWGLGGLQLQAGREFDDPRHAIFYVTKYLIKQPEKGYPIWVLESKKTIRFFQGSGKLGSILLAGKPVASCENDESGEKHEPRKRGEPKEGGCDVPF
ncbi:MAG: hypothetical protein ACYC26_12610 [Phycisphaerales bacterium]